jgi:hypothetical protein
VRQARRVRLPALQQRPSSLPLQLRARDGAPHESDYDAASVLGMRCESAVEGGTLQYPPVGYCGAPQEATGSWAPRATRPEMQCAAPSGVALSMTVRSIGASPSAKADGMECLDTGSWEQPTWHSESNRRFKATFTASTFAGFKGRSPGACARNRCGADDEKWDDGAVINIRDAYVDQDGVYFPSISKVCSKGALCTNWACARAYWGAIRVGLKDDWHAISRRRAAKVRARASSGRVRAVRARSSSGRVRAVRRVPIDSCVGAWQLGDAYEALVASGDGRLLLGDMVEFGTLHGVRAGGGYGWSRLRVGGGVGRRR